MPSDLQVTNIQLPSPLRAPCAATLLVTFTNAGPDPTAPAPVLVAVDVSASSDDLFAGRFRTQIGGFEGFVIAPGESRTVAVEVEFPCLQPVWIRADVDPAHQVSNNLHSQPPLTIQAKPLPVPWLMTALRVGLKDSAGAVTWDPATFCPTTDLVVEVKITNRGCAASPATATVVTLEDPSSTPIGTSTIATPSIAAGATWTATANLKTPPLAAGATQMLAVRACADAKQAIPDQCDQSSLCAVVTKALESGGRPRLSLFIGRLGGTSIFPGEDPGYKYTIGNDCADIGLATVRILFGTSLTEIYRAQVPVGLHQEVVVVSHHN